MFSFPKQCFKKYTAHTTGPNHLDFIKRNHSVEGASGNRPSKQCPGSQPRSHTLIREMQRGPGPERPRPAWQGGTVETTDTGQRCSQDREGHTRRGRDISDGGWAG